MPSHRPSRPGHRAGASGASEESRGFKLTTGSDAGPSCGPHSDGFGTNRQAAAVVACATLRPLHRFAERLQQDMRSTERRLRIHDHLFQLGLVSLPAFFVGGHERFDGRGEQLVAAVRTWPRDVRAPGHPVSVQPTSREACSRRRKARRSGSRRRSSRCCGRGAKALDQRHEVIVRRIPPGHEESLQAPVASLEQQDAVGGLAVAAGSARLLVVDVE